MNYMPNLETVMWPGNHGHSYKYEVYPLPPNLKPLAGNYIFARRNSFGLWVPVYIGETENLAERFDAHHKAQCIIANRATHIHAHLNPNGQLARRAEEADLIVKHRPTCNG